MNAEVYFQVGGWGKGIQTMPCLGISSSWAFTVDTVTFCHIGLSAVG
jgi:hypothetical protein